MQDMKYESGLDNSPMFDDALADDETKALRLDQVGLSALWAAEAEFMACIAREIGREPDARAFDSKRKAMADAIDGKLRNSRIGMNCNHHWDRESVRDDPAVPLDGLFSRRIGVTNAYPLIGGVPDRKRGQQVIDYLTDPRNFWGEFVCPTIARHDPGIRDQDYWRGRIWGPTNYLLWQGIKRYASDAVRREYADKCRRLFMMNWLNDGTCSENYHATGRPASDPHYTWGALLCLIALEDVCDIEPDGRVRLSGTIGASIGIRNIPIHGKLYDVDSSGGTTRLRYQGRTVAEAKGEAVRVELHMNGGLRQV